jgi:hypothetical protein
MHSPRGGRGREDTLSPEGRGVEKIPSPLRGEGIEKIYSPLRGKE